MKKKIISIILAGIMLMMCACGNGASQEPMDENIGVESDASKDEAGQAEASGETPEETSDISASDDSSEEDADVAEEKSSEEGAVDNDAESDSEVSAEEEVSDDQMITDEFGGAVMGENGVMYFPCTLEDAQIAAMSFLQLGIEGTKAVISNDFYADDEHVMERQRSGEFFNFLDLLEMVKDEYIRRDNDVMPDISYAFINNNNSGNYSFAVKFSNLDIYSIEDGSYAIYVFQPNGDLLDLVFSTAVWCRHNSVINEYGYTACIGSAGAGESPFDEGLITQFGKYETVYKGDATCGMWTSADLGTVDEYNACVEEASDLADLYIDRYDIGDERVCFAYNNFSDRHDMDIITPVTEVFSPAKPLEFSEKTQEFMIMCVENGKVNWVTDGDLLERINKRREELRVSDDVLGARALKWTEASYAED